MHIHRSLAAVMLALSGFIAPAWAGADTAVLTGSPAAPEKAAPPKAVAEVAPKAQDAPPLGPDSRLETLPNGLTVLIKADKRFPMVSTRLLVHAGAAYEKPEEAGVSHLLEHMVFKGTETRPGGEVARQIEAAGGYMNAFTSTDYTCYLTDLPAKHWKLGMDVARDMAFHPLLNAGDLATEQNVVVEEMKLYKDKPYSELYQSISRSVLKGTVYEDPVIGFEKTVRGVTVASMKAYMQRLYQPRNMLLAVVGDVNPDEVLAEARAQFGKYTNTAPLPLVQPVDAATLTPAERFSVQSGPWNKAYLAVAVPVPGGADARTPAMDVLAYLLGGDETSLLYKTYKYERQLVDSISVQNISHDRVGMFAILVALDVDKVVPFWQALSTDLANIKSVSFTPEQIRRARLNLEDAHFRERESLDDLATQLAYYQFFQGGEQGEINTLAALNATDMAQLRTLMDEWIVPGRMSVALFAPEATVKDGLADKLRTVTDKGLTTAATAEAAAKADAAGTETIDLGNGRTVVLITDRTLPYFAADLHYSGGELLLTPEQQGLATLTAGVLTRGTAKMDNSQLAEYLSDRAAGLAAGAGLSGFTVSLAGQTRFAPELFGVMAETLTTPAFRDEEVARQKKDQLASIRASEDQPMSLAARKINPFLFPGSAYGYQTLGSMEGVAAFTRKQVADYWNSQKTRPWVLAVAGDFDREAVLAFAKSLPVPTQPALNLTPPTWTKDHKLSLSLPQRQQAHLMMVYKTVPTLDADTPALTLLSEVLGGMGGPLFSKLRDEMGLGYTVRMFNRQDMANGYAMFYIGTDPGKMEQAMAGFTQLINDMRVTPFSAADLERGYNQFEGGYWRSMQTLGARAGQAARLTATGRPLDYPEQLMARMKALTPADLVAVAKKYLVPAQAYTITVLPD